MQLLGSLIFMETAKSFDSRKQDHIKLALNKSTQSLVENQFSQIGLIHEALPEINFFDVDTRTQLLKHSFSSPLFISSMTAGHAQGYKINVQLARLASEKNILFSVGSQKKELFDKKATLEFKKIRDQFKNLKIVSNIGLEEVVQQEASSILKIVENTDSIGLFVHLNPLQEVFQKTGENVFFKNGLKAIERLVQKSPVPVLVKEVGFGISPSTSKKLFNCGVTVVDVSGSGGTHWGMIEALRSSDSVKGKAILAFHDWGMTTVQCLLEHQTLVKKTPQKIWASGGIRNGVDAAKCLAMGAEAVGFAQPLLRHIVDHNLKIKKFEFLEGAFEQLQFELKTALFCAGIQNMRQLRAKKVWYEK